MNTCYYGQNDTIYHFSAGWQDLKSPSWSVKLSAGYIDHCRPVYIPVYTYAMFIEAECSVMLLIVALICFICERSGENCLTMLYWHPFQQNQSIKPSIQDVPMDCWNLYDHFLRVG